MNKNLIQIFVFIQIIFQPYNLFSQYKSEEKLLEGDAAEYLRLGGYGYEITRQEDGSSGLIEWSGHNGSVHDKVIMSYSFYPFNTGIATSAKSYILSEKPNLNSWKSSLPKNFKIVSQSSNEIIAADSRNFDNMTQSRVLRRANKPYYGDNYLWSHTFINHYKPISVNKIGFNYNDSNDENQFYSFLSEDTFDLYGMAQTFLLDYMSYLASFATKLREKNNPNSQLIKAAVNSSLDIDMKRELSFQKIDGENTLAIALGKDDDSKINIIVDPDKWYSLSDVKRLYILYHELGHDIFNFDHGNGGKMMYNYIDKSVTWKDFLNDRINLFETYIAKNIPPEKHQKETNEGVLIFIEVLKRVPNLYKKKEYEKIINVSKFFNEVLKSELMNQIIEYPDFSFDKLYQAFIYIGDSHIKSGNDEFGCIYLNNILEHVTPEDKSLEMKVKSLIMANCNQ